MRILYHFPTSVFSRRARLALAHKGLVDADELELRDARANEAYLAEARRLTPLRTMPVLVDGVDQDGRERAIGDSGAIAQYLDLAYPDRPMLWPTGAPSDEKQRASVAHETLVITSAIDVAMNTLVDMGTRNWDLRTDKAWERVLRERMARAQGAIDSVGAICAKKAEKPNLVGDAWSVADIWTLSATLWVAGMPARAANAPLVAQILTLGFRLPESLLIWAKQHEARPDVRAIYGS